MFLLPSHARLLGRQSGLTRPTEYYRRAIYIALLDCVIADLNGRFRGGILDIVSKLARFIPARMISDSSEYTYTC